ncbi:MAG: hypothetical protein JRJ19_16875, partial [Deltaproteobacteria bacterium]|nr:hypothetical protein [Deltaproteobacteria bacterium]
MFRWQVNSLAIGIAGFILVSGLNGCGDSDDASLPSGKRVQLSERATIFTPADDLRADPTSVHPADGFSHLSQILALFPGGVDPDDLVFHTDDLSLSLTADSPTLLIEAQTGTPVLHFAELDPRAESDEQRAMLIRPLERLKNATRYIVAIHGLRTPDGNELKAPEGFRRIREGLVSGHEILEPLAERYESEIFPVIEQFGVARDDLILAWDFTTETLEHVTKDMLAVREQIINILSANPPQVTISEVVDDVDQHIYREIEGTIRVPLFMESAQPDAWLNRDEDGNVVQNGETEVEFTILIPKSLAERAPTDPPGRLLQHGHGFFGTRASGPLELGRFIDEHGMVLMAVDWWGMSRADSITIIDAIASRPSEIAKFTDRVHQGMANSMALVYAAKGPLLEEPALQIGQGQLYDPEKVYFIGNSAGHILGGTYVALSPHIERAALGVGGAGFSFIMFRSRSFMAFLDFIEMYLPDPLDIQKFAMLTQTTFDRMDPITYAPHLLQDTYLDGPQARHLLMHVGIGDAQVPNLSAHL